MVVHFVATDDGQTVFCNGKINAELDLLRRLTRIDFRVLTRLIKSEKKSWFGKYKDTHEYMLLMPEMDVHGDFRPGAFVQLETTSSVPQIFAALSHLRIGYVIADRLNNKAPQT